ncbi:MAG: hypothetical protein ABJC39_02440 [Chloroflexota bacterium]
MAGGWKSDAGNGSVPFLLSVDGRTWQRADEIPAFSGGSATGLAAVGDGYVAVGSTEWPDDRVATIWLSPPPP